MFEDLDVATTSLSNGIDQATGAQESSDDVMNLLNEMSGGLAVTQNANMAGAGVGAIANQHV